MNDITYFNYHGSDIRTLEAEDEIWWVLKDICDVLGLSNPRSVADRLDEDERRKLDLPRQGETWFVSESGLYSVILRSDKPEAKPFRRWVTHEVLPSIRKYGSYGLSRKPLPQPKTWYGEEVVTTADVSEYFGITISGARDCVIRNLREGLDYFLLKGNSLKCFKHENPQFCASTASAIFLIKISAFNELIAR